MNLASSIRKRIECVPIKRNMLPIVFVFSLVCAMYYYFSSIISKNIFTPTIFNYYIYLIDSFFHGHTSIDSPIHYDLSLFKNNYYMYWGPEPVLFILPFYLLWHLQASDVLYTVIGGLMNVALFYFVIQEFKKYFAISISLIAEIFLLLSFAFASPNFFLSLYGNVWYTGQIFAISYLLLFYLFYFKFLNNKKYYQLLLCITFFCLAWLSRYTLLFHSILFIYLFMQYKNSGSALQIQKVWSLALLVLTFVCLIPLYNYLRFHNMLETGVRFQMGATRYNPIVRSNAILSIHYILYNIHYYFLNSVQFSRIGYPVVIDTEGNSIFSVYPALLLLPVVVFSRIERDKKRFAFLIIGAIVVILTLIFLLLYFATGWVQFGSRYFFDIVPLLFLMLIFVLPSIPIYVQLAVLVYGIFVNVYGIVAFYHLPIHSWLPLG